MHVCYITTRHPPEDEPEPERPGVEGLGAGDASGYTIR